MQTIDPTSAPRRTGPSTVRRSVAWLKEPDPGAEWADVVLARDRLRARGIAIGGDPFAYRLDWDLETGPRWVTTRLRVVSRADGWERRLDLRRAPDGGWTTRRESRGEAPLASLGDDPMDALSQALDCDLGLCPLTNTMPVMRHRLLDDPGGPVELTMAFVSVPDLAVSVSRQEYASLRRDGDVSVIRYRSGSFEAEVGFDADGLVVDYAGLARRL